MDDRCKIMMGGCPFREERKPMSAANWWLSYSDAKEYLEACETQEQLWLLSRAATEDAADSGVVVDVWEMFDELREQWLETKRELRAEEK